MKPFDERFPESPASKHARAGREYLYEDPWFYGPAGNEFSRRFGLMERPYPFSNPPLRWRDNRGKAPKNYRRSDARIMDDIYMRLNQDVLVDSSNVEVHVNNGEVTLTGTVASRPDKYRLEDHIESISGVTNVENRIRVSRENSSDPGSADINLQEKNADTQLKSFVEGISNK